MLKETHVFPHYQQALVNFLSPCKSFIPGFNHLVKRRDNIQLSVLKNRTSSVLCVSLNSKTACGGASSQTMCHRVVIMTALNLLAIPHWQVLVWLTRALYHPAACRVSTLGWFAVLH